MKTYNIDDVFNRLEQMGKKPIKNKRGGFESLCPSHNDINRRSCSFNVGDDGRILVKCHVGCTYQSVLDSMGEPFKYGAYKVPKAPQRNAQAKRTNYPVKNLNGDVIAVQVRMDYQDKPKQIWFEMPNGTRGLQGISRDDLPLYGTETLRVLPDNATVIVAEGPKCVDSLHEQGFHAVGTVASGGGTPSRESLEPLKRFNVVLWADKDESGLGEKCMDRIGATLTVIGVSSIKTIDLDQFVTNIKGYDCVDAVEDGRNIVDIVRNAGDWVFYDGVDLGDLLNRLIDFYSSYLIISSQALIALALWVVHTHAFLGAETTPYIHVNSPVKRSGKSRVLEVSEHIVSNPLMTGKTSVSNLVRQMAQSRSTLLLDEADATFKGDKEYSETLRGVLNTGFRKGGKYSMSVKEGGDWTPKNFDVFSPKMISGIGVLPETIMDRSINIQMRRKLKHEKVERLRLRDVAKRAEPIRNDIADWSDFYTPLLSEANPLLPDELDDRAQDIWEPLLAIAELAGDEFAELARRASVVLSGEQEVEVLTLEEQLLSDIKTICSDRVEISSKDLVNALCELEGGRWGEFSRGKPLTQNRLARLLAPFNIKTSNIRFSPDSQSKGYTVADFVDSWNRYIPDPSVTPVPNEELSANSGTDGTLGTDHRVSVKGGVIA